MKKENQQNSLKLSYESELEDKNNQIIQMQIRLKEQNIEKLYDAIDKLKEILRTKKLKHRNAVNNI